MKSIIQKIISKIAFLLLLIVFIGCQNLTEENKAARKELLDKEINYSEQTYIDAVKSSNIVTVKLLLSAGMPVDIINSKGYPVLYNAVINGNVDMLKLLIKKGANVNFQHPAWKYSPLMKASGKFHNKKIVKYLLKNGANPFLKEYHGYTAIDIAFQNENKDIVKIIQEHIKKLEIEKKKRR